jgi:hypothetical protein
MATPASPDALLNGDLEQLAASQQGIASYDNEHLDALARPLRRRLDRVICRTRNASMKPPRLCTLFSADGSF